MNQFVQRVVNYVANEILIKGLANSKTFQRFAVKTDHSLRKGTESLQQTIEELSKQQVRTSHTSTTARRPPPIKPQTGVFGFLSAFVKEIRQDFGGGVGNRW
jgi:hypothetical protein